MTELTPTEQTVVSKIYIFRNQRVMMDFDLAEIYGVETKVLKQAVRRNLERFPEDFIFELTQDEFKTLRSQIVTSKKDGLESLRYQFGTSKTEEKRGGTRYPPFAFTEHGTVMLASVLNSEKAVKASIFVVRAFVKLRQLINSYNMLSERINELEDKYDGQIEQIIYAIKKLSEQKNEPREPIGFKK